MEEPIILFRKNKDNEDEFNCANKIFPCAESRVELRDNLAIGRYSVLPYYQELEKDLSVHDSVLINSYKQHKWIANFEYYSAVSKFTPKTWFDGFNLPENTKFIVKGATNSKKSNWKSMMFADNKKEAILISTKLQEDGLIGNQNIIFREYIPLVTYEIGVNGLPFTNEWRLFFYKQNLLSYGYYWSIADEAEKRIIDSKCISKANEIAKIVSTRVNFFVLDLAQTESGEWILIEINDGQMSGLSLNDPTVLYSNLKRCLIENDNRMVYE